MWARVGATSVMECDAGLNLVLFPWRLMIGRLRRLGKRPVMVALSDVVDANWIGYGGRVGTVFLIQTVPN